MCYRAPDRKLEWRAMKERQDGAEASLRGARRREKNRNLPCVNKLHAGGPPPAPKALRVSTSRFIVLHRDGRPSDDALS
jgi:hypothetical protein